MNIDLEKNFKLAKKQDRKAQKWLFDCFSAKMLAISNSYLNNIHDAEDVVMNSFYKCFTKLEDCKEWKAFPSWFRRIVVNDSINFLRKSKSILFVETSDFIDENIIDDEEEFEDVNIQEILSQLPEGYRIVFNLYVFEEKKHSEIATILGVSEGTSKSQLSKAKMWISNYLKKNRNDVQKFR